MSICIAQKPSITFDQYYHDIPNVNVDIGAVDGGTNINNYNIDHQQQTIFFRFLNGKVRYSVCACISPKFDQSYIFNYY
jgi:hypothetical protein